MHTLCFHIAVLSVLAGAVVVPGGCSDSPAAEPDPATQNIDPGAFAGKGRVRPARTPREAVAHLLESVQLRDPVLFDSTIALDQVERRYAKECFATEAMLHEFLEAMERCYGQSVGRQIAVFESLDRRGRWPAPADALPDLRVAAGDSRALATLPGPNDMLLHLRKDNGVWRVEFAEHLPHPADRQPLIEAYRKLRPILLKVRPLDGAPEQTPQTVWSAFMTAVHPPTWTKEESESEAD
ncbi:MAG: hypothetical protein KGY81_00775 [Phycisphaerae bacterium]|nr:hypothetical protein [Phycisphaerae bacterium]